MQSVILPCSQIKTETTWNRGFHRNSFGFVFILLKATLEE